MAKYVCEIDTETNEMSFTVDGKKVEVTDASVGSYSYNYCNCDGEPESCQFLSASYAIGSEKKKTRYSTYISKDSKGINTTTTVDDWAPAEAMAKAISLEVQKVGLQKLLKERK